NAWIEIAEDLAEQSICRALTRAGLCEADLDAIFFVSVTGVASPSIDARLMNRMNLRPDIKRNPIFGLGCVAGAAGLARAADYVRAFPKQCAVLVSVELCSLTWQRKDLSVANLISSGLFGDGSAAVIVAGSERSVAGPQVLGTRSSFYRGTEDAMGWDISDGALDVSWQVLRRVGNLSSASVLLVLEEFMNRRRPAVGSYSILAAMGPGFCSELVLLRW